MELGCFLLVALADGQIVPGPHCTLSQALLNLKPFFSTILYIDNINMYLLLDI